LVFRYIEYGLLRLREYFRLKAEFEDRRLASRA
jgi:hypothetical protein